MLDLFEIVNRWRRECILNNKCSECPAYKQCQNLLALLKSLRDVLRDNQRN